MYEGGLKHMLYLVDFRVQYLKMTVRYSTSHCIAPKTRNMIGSNCQRKYMEYIEEFINVPNFDINDMGQRGEIV